MPGEETSRLEQLQRLLSRQMEGALSERERRELADLLRSDSAVRSAYARHCQMESMLAEEIGLLAPLAEQTPPRNIVPMDHSSSEPAGPVSLDSVGDDKISHLRYAVAACLLGSLILLGLVIRHEVREELAARETEPSPAVAGSDAPQGNEAASDAETPDSRSAAASPEEQYEEKLVAMVNAGSQKRPPTPFTSPGPAAPEGRVDFSRDIRPILSDNCFLCHGPSESDRKADLRLDTPGGMLADLGGYQAVVPGDPDASELVARIFNDDREEIMPPPKSHKTLDDRQKDLLKQWIAEGAEWQDHWAFVPPIREAVPEVSDAAWPKNEIDRFALARLDEAGLKPSPEADRHALIRRLTFDLTGLPPTPEEVEAFAGDESPDAYEIAVNRLLDSPRFGEHRARYWLDAVRYADTHGFHFDNYRSIWPYRDWVVRAFNENMPFDRFTVEQLAGDLLPGATLEQRIATGFNRCNPTTNEGGVIDEEYLAIYAKDRVETTSMVWLGLTTGCASCHDHKFDPLSQKEFYQLVAYFNNTTQPARDGNKPDTPPNLVVPAGDDRDRWGQLPAEIDSVKKQMADRKSHARAAFDAWAVTADPRDSIPSAGSRGLTLHLPLDEGQGQSLHNAAGEADEVFDLPRGAEWDPAGKSGAAIRIAGDAGIRVQRVSASVSVDADAPARSLDYGDFDTDQAFSYGAWVKVAPDFKGSAAVLSRMSEQEAHRGWDLWLEGGKRFGAHFIQSWSDNAMKVLTKNEVVKPGEWMHVFVTYNGSGIASGVKLYIDGKAEPLQVVNDNLNGTIRTGIGFWIGQRSSGSVFAGGSLQDVRIYGRSLSAAEVATLANEAHFEQILAIAPEKRTKEQADELFGYYLERQDKPHADLEKQLLALEQEQAGIGKRGAITLVTQENEGAEPVAHILERGEYDRKGEEVRPGVPAVLPAMAAGAPANRLGLAQWIVDPGHPLTARVTVNRYWQELFGTGLVKTAEDFGTQGEPASHPKLLDWLAVEFVESGWDVKHLFQLMVTSATYRQSARATPELHRRDAENRLLARGPRFRLDAEMLRDQALFVSDLLVAEVGGPAVKPYQPPGLWEVVAYPKSDTAVFVQDREEKIYRRSLYTFWKRTSPPPNMSIFDAPERESCIARRERTNTPLQALVLMNDPQFVEAARHLAGRVLTERPERAERIRRMAAIVLGRPLQDEEMAVLEESLAAFEEKYLGDGEAASRLISFGDSPPDDALKAAELASWTMLANQMLNLDEAINKN